MPLSNHKETTILLDVFKHITHCTCSMPKSLATAVCLDGFGPHPKLLTVQICTSISSLCVFPGVVSSCVCSLVLLTPCSTRCSINGAAESATHRHLTRFSAELCSKYGSESVVASGDLQVGPLRGGSDMAWEM